MIILANIVHNQGLFLRELLYGTTS